MLITQVLTGTTFTKKFKTKSFPFVISFASSDATRKIEISVNDGVTYIEPDVDAASTASYLILTVSAPITHIKVTGAIADTLYILTKDN